jgi:hypothetical protein
MVEASITDTIREIAYVFRRSNSREQYFNKEKHILRRVQLFFRIN